MFLVGSECLLSIAVENELKDGTEQILFNGLLEIMLALTWLII